MAKQKQSTQKRVLRMIRRHHPARPAAFRKLGIRLKGEGAGSFRTVYQIVGAPLVVKFPMPDTDFAINKVHTRTELARIKKFRRFRWMHKYLPKVYYYNPKTGVSVVEFVDDSKTFVKQTRPYSSREQRMIGMCQIAEDLIFRLTGTRMTDINVHNVRFDQKREVSKFIDLAY